MKTEKWFENYIALLKEGKTEEAMQNKKAILPTSLFKYCPLDKNSLECLFNNSIFMAPADIKNDPFECTSKYEDSVMTQKFFRAPEFQEIFKAEFNSDISINEIDVIQNSTSPEKKFHEICVTKGIKRNFKDVIKRRIDLVNSEIKEFMRSTFFSSFSEINDSTLMWSHYSEKHKGICIDYDFSNDDKIIQFLEPVYYTEQRNSVTDAFGFDKKKNTFRIAAFTKAKDWEYEKEWRIVFPHNKKGHYKVPKPKAIYLGTRFDENKVEFKEYLLNLTKILNIPLYKMKLHDTEYKIIKDE